MRKMLKTPKKISAVKAEIFFSFIILPEGAAKNFPVS